VGRKDGSDVRRRGTRIAVSWTLLAALALVARYGHAASDNPQAADIVLRWRDGPIRYLLTTQEDEVVRELTSIPDLERFITKFWKRRDPTPTTLTNESRRLFWARVRVANERFKDSAEPGWKSDRGKVYILMGEPQEVESVEARARIPDTLTFDDAGTRPRSQGEDDEARIAEAGNHEVIRWHYMRSRSRMADPEIIVAFVRDETGAWRLSSDGRYLEPQYSTVNTDPAQDATFGHQELRAASQAAETFRFMFAQEAARSSPAQAKELAGVMDRVDDVKTGIWSAGRGEPVSSLFINEDLGLEMSAPSNAELGVAAVMARDFVSTFTPEPRFEYFRARDGNTFVNMGALARELGSAGRTRINLYARVRALDDERIHFVSNEQPGGGEPDPTGGKTSGAWVGLALRPGRYAVTMALEDATDGRVGRTDAVIDVPDFSGSQWRISTLVLATELASEEGKLVVVERSSGIFRRSDAFALYYEVYGIASGERFTSTYSFFRKDEAGSWIPLGRPVEQPDLTEGAQGWSFPLAKWPLGRYRVDVTVMPVRVEGKTTLTPGATGSVSFEVSE